jgi:hypothetical protein
MITALMVILLLLKDVLMVFSYYFGAISFDVSD